MYLHDSPAIRIQQRKKKRKAISNLGINDLCIIFHSEGNATGRLKCSCEVCDKKQKDKTGGESKPTMRLIKKKKKISLIQKSVLSD